VTHKFTVLRDGGRHTHKKADFGSAARKKKPRNSLETVGSGDEVNSNRPNVLGNDQYVELPEHVLDALFELPEKFLRLAVGARDNFDLDNVLDEIDAAIIPRALVGRVMGAHRPRTKDVDQLFANLFDLFGFDLGAIVILQWQIDLVLLHAANNAEQ
jgi:hypothetical protein